MGVPPRAPRALLPVVPVLAALAILLPLLGVPAPSASAARAAPAAPAAVVPAAPTQRATTDDFPRLPSQCYDANDVITSPCRITRFPGRPMVVLWGDSHAQMYLPAVRRLARNQRVNLVAVLFGGCPISQPYPRSSRYPRTGCDQHNLDSLAYVRDLTQRRKHVRILIGGFWSGYRHAYELTQEEERTGIPSGLTDYRKQMARLGTERSAPMFRTIGRLGVPVDLIGQAATVPLDPRQCNAGRKPYQCDLPRHRALYKERDNARWIRTTLASRLPGRPRIIDATPTYCGRTTCFAHVGPTDTFYDDIHLTASLTATMAGYFRPVFRDVLAR